MKTFFECPSISSSLQTTCNVIRIEIVQNQSVVTKKRLQKSWLLQNAEFGFLSSIRMNSHLRILIFFLTRGQYWDK